MTKTQRQKRMQRVVADFQKYVATYDSEVYSKDYADKTFVNDMLYGIGVALDPEKYKGATGFEKFKHDCYLFRVIEVELS
jgi:hypothetical protein